jgi:hypothetical protein
LYVPAGNICVPTENANGTYTIVLSCGLALIPVATDNLTAIISPIVTSLFIVRIPPLLK